MIRHAYDIATLPRPADRGAPDNHGWIFGLPPGLTPEKWPLDPASGYPLQHGFTLALPPDYRCHGPEIVAMSFFAKAFDHGEYADEAMIAATLGDAPPEDRRYRPFWRDPGQRHPRVFRFKDILDQHYAVILLTQAEFDGPLCAPPETPRDGIEIDARRHRVSGTPGADGAMIWTYAYDAPRPAWLDHGAMSRFCAFSGASDESTPETFGLFGILGGRPRGGREENRGLRWTPRARDPNAGVTPCDSWDPKAAGSSYAQPLYEDANGTYQWRDWAVGQAPNHIGGTMFPSQSVPDFSPYYVEFEETFGGYNFGGGNAQLDFKAMKFDWACG